MINIPEVKVEKEDGFQNDIFGRKDFGSRLANLVESSGGSVIALDANWGEGKTTFIKMWQGYIAHHREGSKLKSIYFDAFSNDYQSNSLLSLMLEIYEKIDDKSLQESFQEKAFSVVKFLSKEAVKSTVSNISGGLVDASKIVDIVQSDSKHHNFLEEAKANKDSLKDFREELQKFAIKYGNGKPLVFIVDELDRCRPDFALEVLENIKHIFSIKDIVFLLAVNRKQLEDSVRLRYGTNNDQVANEYLQKFVHLWLQLPTTISDEKNLEKEQYISYLFEDSLGASYPSDESPRKLFIDLVRKDNLSFRQIERMFAYLLALELMGDVKKWSNAHHLLCVFAVYLKTRHPDIIDKILFASITLKEIRDESGLSTTPRTNSIMQLIDLIEYIYTGSPHRTTTNLAYFSVVDQKTALVDMAKSVSSLTI